VDKVAVAPVGSGVDKSRCNNQQLGGKGAVSTGSIGGTAMAEQGRTALVGA